MPVKKRKEKKKKLAAFFVSRKHGFIRMIANKLSWMGGQNMFMGFLPLEFECQ